MTTHLIRFLRGGPTGKLLSAAIVDVDVGDPEISARVYVDGGNVNCPSCRENARRIMAVERAHMIKLVPAGRVWADVCDVSHEPRVLAEHKNRTLRPDRFVRDLAATAPPASTRH